MQMRGLISGETPSRSSSVASNAVNLLGQVQRVVTYLVHNKVLLHQELLLVRTTIITLDSKEKYLHKTYI